MADFSANTDLGTQVITGSKIWSGGATGTVASPTDINFTGAGATNVVVSGSDITVVANAIGNGHGTTTNGSIVLTGCILNIVDPGGTGQTRICGITNGTYNFTDTTIVGSLGAYATWGAWNTVQGTYNLNNFTLATDILTGDLATLSFFTGNLSANSSFNNPAFWNGLAGADARGGVWQTSTNQIYNGVVTPPAGIDFNHTNLRAFHRWANQITGNPLTTTNHTGVAPNFDFRSLQHVDNSAAAFFLDVDGGASMAHVNWLPGVPTNSLRHGFKCIFGVGARAQVFIATNPVLANPAGTDGEHLLNFTTADITSTANLGVYLPSTEAWDPTTAGTPVWDGEMITNKSQAVTTATLNGLYFRNQKFEESTGALNTSDASFAEFVDLAPKTYRKYSWLQQPTDADGWGKEVTISVPPNNATDAEVATARDGGYDVYNGTTWETETDISDATDQIIANTPSVDTFAKAYLNQDQSSSSALPVVTTGSELVAACKALAWHSATGASDFTTDNVDRVGTTNNHVPLGYTITGTTVTFPGDIGVTTARGERDIQSNGIGYNVKINGTVLQDDFVTAIVGNVVRLSAPIDGTQANCAFSAEDQVYVNNSISNLVLTARNSDGDGIINGKQNASHAPTLITYDSDIIYGRLGTGTYTTEELLGANYTIVGGTHNTLRPSGSNQTLTLTATDANVAEFNLTANPDGTGGELPRGGTLTIIHGTRTTVWNRPSAPAVSYPVNIGIPANTTGRFVINNQATDAVLYAGTWDTSGTITTTADNRVTDASGNVGVGSEDATIYQWFAKAESTIGGGVYRMGGGTFQGTALPEGSIVTATPAVVNNFFVQNATEENGADGSTLLAVTNTSAGNKFQFIWSNTSSTSPAGGNATQGAMIKGANSVNYFNWLVANNYTADPVDYRPGSVIWNNDADDVTGIATLEGVYNNSSAANVGNVIGNASLGLKSDNLTGVTGVTQVQSVDDGEASLATVNNAIAGLFAQSAGLTEQAFDDIMDQINTKVNTSSLGIPTSGDLN